MRAKLGLPAGLDDAVSRGMVGDLLELMRAGRVDHTPGFRALGGGPR